MIGNRLQATIENSQLNNNCNNIANKVGQKKLLHSKIGTCNIATDSCILNTHIQWTIQETAMVKKILTPKTAMMMAFLASEFMMHFQLTSGVVLENSD